MKTELIKCTICGEEFDPSNLSTVFLHEHRDDLNPSIAIGIKGVKIKTAQEFYEQERLDGNTYDITSNPNPDYSLSFYQAIFRLMDNYSTQWK